MKTELRRRSIFGFPFRGTVRLTEFDEELDLERGMLDAPHSDETLLSELTDEVAALARPTQSGIRRSEQIRYGIVGGAGILFGLIVGSVFVLPGLVAFLALGVGAGYAAHVYVAHRRDTRLRREAARWLGHPD